MTEVRFGGQCGPQFTVTGVQTQAHAERTPRAHRTLSPGQVLPRGRASIAGILLPELRPSTPAVSAAGSPRTPPRPSPLGPGHFVCRVFLKPSHPGEPHTVGGTGNITGLCSDARSHLLASPRAGAPWLVTQDPDVSSDPEHQATGVHSHSRPHQAQRRGCPELPPVHFRRLRLRQGPGYGALPRRALRWANGGLPKTASVRPDTECDLIWKKSLQTSLMV